MKKLLFAFLLILVAQLTHAQLRNLLKRPLKQDSSRTSSIGSAWSNLRGDEITGALKEALNKGIERSTDLLSSKDGFFKNAAVKILLPPEAQKIEKTLRGLGLDNEVDQAILTMNRAAEDASKSAAPIFLDAVKRMTITDAANILRGSDTAATSYLKASTTSALTAAFRPIVDSSLSKVDATKYWSTLTTTYNQLPLVKKVETDLTTYVTDKALQGLFYEIGAEEKQIRKNPAERTTDLLKKVFAKQ